MGLTLTQARTAVLDFLDDAGSARWSTTQVDTALAYALSACQNDYVSAGGDKFDELLVVDTISGAVDMSVQDPIKILGVSVLIGNRNFPISEVSYEERGKDDTTIRALTIRFVRSLAVPTVAGSPLVGNATVAAKSWLAFDHWVCVKAALYCSTKDAESRSDLSRLEKENRELAVFKAAIPKSLPFPSRPHWYSVWLSFAWKANDQSLVICNRS